MIADILLSNRAAVLAQIDRLQGRLAFLSDLLTTDDDARLRELAASTTPRVASFWSNTADDWMIR